MATCDRQALMDAANAAGFGSLEPGQLEVLITQLLCELKAGGGGGGGGGSGTVGPGTPNRIAKFTGATTVDDSLLGEDGTNLGVASTLGLAWSASADPLGVKNLTFKPDSVNTLALRSGSTSTVFRIINSTLQAGNFTVTSNGDLTIAAHTGKSIILSPNGTLGASVAINSAHIGPDADNTLNIGSDSSNGAWKDLYMKGSIYLQGSNDGAGNYSRMRLRHDNSVIIFESLAAGTGVVRPFRFQGHSVVIGSAALATNATDGFLYIPTSAGTPTGTPTTQTGTAPIQIDTTNNKLHFYSSGAWQEAGGGGGGGIGGSGTAGTIPIFTAGTTLGNSTITKDANNDIVITNTWNNGATTFTGLKLNVTNTASAAASRLLNLQVGGASQFSVSPAGSVFAGAGADGWFSTPGINYLQQGDGSSYLWIDAVNSVSGTVREAYVAGQTTIDNGTDTASARLLVDSYSAADSAGTWTILSESSGATQRGVLAYTQFPVVESVLLFEPSIANGASAVAYKFDTANNLTTAGALLARFDNATVTKLSITKDGDIYPRNVITVWPAANAAGVLTNNGSGTLSWAAAGGGGGDVVGPGSSTDEAITRFDGTTGKLLQNSTVTLSDTGVITLPSGGALVVPTGAYVMQPGDADSGLFWSSASILQVRFNAATLAQIDNTQAAFLAGTATVPGIGFLVDPDVGIYRPAANTLGIAAAGGLVTQFVGGGGVQTVASAGAITYGFQNDTDSGYGWVSADILKLVTGGGTRHQISTAETTISHTWNAGATTFTGLEVNITDTASAAASRLLELITGAGTQLLVGKEGGLMVGKNSEAKWLGTPSAGDVLVSIKNIDSGDPDASGIYLGAENAAATVYGRADLTCSSTQSNLLLSTRTLAGVENQISAIVGTVTSLDFSVAGTSRTLLNPTAGATETPYVFDTSVAHTGGALVDFRNNGSSKWALTKDGHIEISGTKVVGARVTGWGAPTGTATRTAFDTGTVTLPQLAERVKALIDDLQTHGLIGA